MSKTLIGAAVASAAIALYGMAGTIEGRIAPVLSEAEIEVSPYGDRKWLEVSGTARRNRMCTLLHLEWRLDESHATLVSRLSSRTATSIDEGVKRRGDFEFGPILLLATERQVGNSYARTFHRCHPFWITRSTFWVGPRA